MTKEECEIETSKAIMEMRSRIAELEEEKAELEEENIELKKLNVSLVDELQLNNSAKDKEIEELINENTELKMQVAMFQKKEREQVTKILMDEYKR